jgi:hypothetical protein
LIALSRARAVAAEAASPSGEKVLMQGPASLRHGSQTFLSAKGGILTLTSSSLTFVAHGFAQKATKHSWSLADLTGVERAWTGAVPNSMRQFNDASFIVAVRNREAWEAALATAKGALGNRSP